MEERAREEGEARERFITGLLLDIPDTGPFARITSCGHPPPLLLRQGRVRALHVRHPAPPFGMCELPDIGYELDVLPFEPGDMVLLYTDGVTEARDRDGVFFPLAERFAQRAPSTPEALLRHLRGDLLAHVGGRLRDDAAMVAIARAARPG